MWISEKHSLFSTVLSDDVFETLYDENWSSCRLDFWFDWN